MKGKLIASGNGINSMMDISYKENLSDENSILVVKDPSDLNSKWQIFERK